VSDAEGLHAALRVLRAQEAEAMQEADTLRAAGAAQREVYAAMRAAQRLSARIAVLQRELGELGLQ
jgi:hypothetical protein